MECLIPCYVVDPNLEIAVLKTDLLFFCINPLGSSVLLQVFKINQWIIITKENEMIQLKRLKVLLLMNNRDKTKNNSQPNRSRH